MSDEKKGPVPIFYAGQCGRAGRFPFREFLGPLGSFLSGNRLKRDLKRGILFLAILLVVACGHKQKKEKNSVSDITVNYPLFSFDFTLDEKSIKDRVLFLDSIGFEGVTFSVRNEKDLEKLVKFQAALKFAKNKHFNIPVVFHALNPDVQEAKRDRMWKNLLNQLAVSKSDLWVIVSQGVKKSFMNHEIVQIFQEMADYADSLHLNIVIYPHDRTTIESASEALVFLKQADRKNLYLSFHLCHEIRAGNGDRINEAVAEVAPFIKYASISGSDRIMNENPPKGYWDDAIKPLYKGDFNTQKFLEALVNNGCNCPVALHTFGLKEPVDEHFSKSFSTWVDMVEKVSAK